MTFLATFRNNWNIFGNPRQRSQVVGSSSVKFQSCQKLSEIQTIWTQKSHTLSTSTINWVPHSRLLGVTVDDKLTWTKYLSDLKKVSINKLPLLKRSRFLPRSVVLDLYNMVILGAYNLCTTCLWGGVGLHCVNKQSLVAQLEAIHCQAARLICNVPKGTPSTNE